MDREVVCIVCPMGCRMSVAREADGQITVRGNTCKRGQTYAIDEFTAPKRTVTASVRIEGASMPLLSVKTNRPVPKDRVGAVLEALSSVRARAPVDIGDVILRDAAGTGADIVATRRLKKEE